MVYKDKEKQRENYRRWYKKNSEKTYTKVKANKKSVREWFDEIKAQYSCAHCDESDPACIVFHHIRDKKMEVSVMVRRTYSKEAILSEIAKCIPLCVNCHRKLHAGIEHGIQYN